MLAGLAARSNAQIVNYTVSFDTTPLLGSTYTGPYSLDVQFFDGGGAGLEPNNTATFSNFTGQSNTISTFSVSDGFPPGTGETIVDFIPGATLSFNISLTANQDIGAPGPDVLSLLLLANGDTISTTDPSGGNAFISFTESQDPLAPLAISSATFDAASGPAFDPVVGSGTAPEPAVLPLLLLGITALPLARRRRP